MHTIIQKLKVDGQLRYQTSPYDTFFRWEDRFASRSPAFALAVELLSPLVVCETTGEEIARRYGQHKVILVAYHAGENFDCFM